ncbi:metallo-hydrolase family protein [Pseudarthrobacter sp. MDT3-26]|uniref:serine hydrolase n=1 Tax=Pseudarthrobacter raffinosi TaxID=2953651 RepID=UPI00208E2FF4|nr:serine hydrolase [Pseudarthrobacter sp. MDT3-26]MCO4261740.1 metallo-hydrolase family protein [Pseudarthrobacter sp. MDT3-26]
MHDSSQPRARRTVAALRRRSALVAAAGFLGVVLIAAAYVLAPARPGQGAASRASIGIDTFSSSAPIDAGLDTAIDVIIGANSQYQVGVALMATDGGAVHQYGVEEPFEAASTAKILTAAAYYHLVEEGSASLDDPLGAFTSEFQIQAMVQDSNNESWSLLMDAVGLSELSEYADSIDVTYDPEVNTLSTAEMAHILAELFEGRLLDQEHTEQLLSYMQDTNYENLIPATVPDGVTVFHKYGLLDNELHDAAVLLMSSGSYVLVVFTKGADLSDIPERTVVIKEITKAVTAALS